MLIALTEGLYPHAQTLDCDDVRGPRSLFGESVPMPRPVGSWDMCSGCLLHEARPFSGYENCAVLWREQEALSAAQRARRILAQACAAPKARKSAAGEAAAASGCALDMPALTYIAGCSTSSFAVGWKLLEDGLLPEWGAVICACQTEGRGRLRRYWHSPRGNLYVTFRLPADPALRGDAASLVTGLILVKAFRRLGFPLSLKWPNDLLLDERGKTGGLLLEEKNGVILAGLGVNLVEIPDPALLRDDCATPAAVLLPQEGAGAFCADGQGGDLLAPFPLWRLLLSAALLEYQASVVGRDFAALCKDIDACLAWRGRRIAVRDSGEAPLSGRFLGLGPGGGLRLSLEGGGQRELFSGSLFLD